MKGAAFRNKHLIIASLVAVQTYCVGRPAMSLNRTDFATSTSTTDNCDKNSSNVVERAELLKSIIAHELHSLDAQGLHYSNPNGFDITDSVSKILPSKMSFCESEQVLIQAGFQVGKRPGMSAAGNRADRFDVYAVSTSLLPKLKWADRKVVVTLRPDSPADYSVLKSLSSAIIVLSP